MDLIATIDVTSTCIGWSRACPAVEILARDVARLALAEGIAASRGVWQVPVELGITLADAAEQQRLNRNYRGQDPPTNVLAFPAWEAGTRVPPGAPLLLGDVVLAFETVAREAAEQQKPLAHHLGHLVAHGVLHLLGFDHLSATEAVAMESLETSILAKLGIPDPYGDPVGSLEAGLVHHE
jgi:probable rRNA maturation factor